MALTPITADNRSASGLKITLPAQVTVLVNFRDQQTLRPLLVRGANDREPASDDAAVDVLQLVDDAANDRQLRSDPLTPHHGERSVAVVFPKAHELVHLLVLSERSLL